MLAQSASSTSPKSVEPKDIANVPNLGSLQKRYQVDVYVAKGGQAEVWKGTDLKTGKPVAIRFPRALCENKFCKVFELDPLTVQEMREACSLALLARQRLELEQLQHPREIGVLIPDGFSTCLHGLSPRPEHVAFEVWSWAGQHTLTEAFFQQTELGVFTIEAKRHILSELLYLVGTMHDGDDSLKKGQQCCCSKKHRVSCIFKGKAQWCPKGYDHVELHRCSEIVHHDLKFDNVMINGVHPIIVDFGAAVQCRQERAKGYSSDWVPAWQQQNALGFSHSLCWSYDSYGIGLIWLVTELLRELSPSHLLCIAAKNAGLSQIEPSLDIQKMIYAYMVGNQSAYAAKSQEVLFLEGCGYFPVNKELRDAASESIAYLVSDLHKHVLVSEHIETLEGFKAALKAFVTDRSALSEQISNLHLLLPNSDIVKNNIFPLLHGCPSLFGTGGRMLQDERQRVLECRQRRSSHSLSMAIQQGRTDLLALAFAEHQAVCMELQAMTANNVWNLQALAGTAWYHVEHSRAIRVLQYGQVRINEIHHGKFRDLHEFIDEKGRPGIRQGERSDGWVLDFTKSNRDMLTWTKLGREDLHWKRVKPVAVNNENVSTSGFTDQCEQDETKSLIMQIIRKNVQGIEMMLRSISESDGKDRVLNIVNQIVQGGESMLALAAQTRQVDIVALLLKHGANPLMVHNDSPKHIPGTVHDFDTGPFPAVFAAAALPKNEDVLQLLLREAVQNKDVEILMEFNLLGLVAKHGDAAMMRLSLQYLKRPPRELNEISYWPRNCLSRALVGDGRWEAPLLIAARAGHALACELLLQAGAEVNVRDQTGWSALALAVQSSSLESVQVLKNGGVELTKIPRVGSLLHLAVPNRDAAMVDLLLKMGISSTEVNTEGDTPLHVAMRTAGIDLRMIDLLGSEVGAYSIENVDDETPLMAALRHCVNPAALKRLLEVGKNLSKSMMTDQWFTAFQMAATRGQAKCLHVLTESASTEHMFDAFRVATMYGQVHVMRALGSVGCRESGLPPIAMSIGRTPFETRYPVQETLKELVALCGLSSLENQDDNGVNALGRWAYEGDGTMLQEIIQLHPQLCNSTFQPPAPSHEPFSDGVGSDTGVTPLALVRLRIKWMEKNFDPNSEVGDKAYYFRKDSRRFSKTTSQRQLVQRLLHAQRVLESADCDGQDQKHEPLSRNGFFLDDEPLLGLY